MLMVVDSRAVIRDELSFKLLCIATVFAAISERIIPTFDCKSFRRVNVFAAISERIVVISVFFATPDKVVPSPLKSTALIVPATCNFSDGSARPIPTLPCVNTTFECPEYVHLSLLVIFKFLTCLTSADVDDMLMYSPVVYGIERSTSVKYNL